MKIKDCWRLAKISLKARKKATRSTVAGISVSLIIIIPLIFAMIGTNVSVKSQMNKHPELLTAVFSSSQKGYSKNDSDEIQNSYFGNRYFYPDFLEDRKDFLDSLDDELLHYVSSVARYDTRHMDESIVVDGETHKIQALPKVQHEESGLAVVMQDDLGMLEASKYGLFGDEFNKGFTGDGARQVLLSRRYLAMAGIRPEDIYGKKISINVIENGSFLQNGRIFHGDFEHSFLTDFEVVGIFGEKPVGKGKDKDDYSINDYNRTYYNKIENCNIIVSSASYYAENDEPKIRHEYYIDEERGYIVCDIGDINAKNELSKDYIFCGAYDKYNSYVCSAEMIDNKFNGKFAFVENHFYKYMPDRNSKNSFDDLTVMLDKVYPAYKNSITTNFGFKTSYVVSKTYSTFVTLNYFLNIIFTILPIFAIVILVAALVNLFNTIMHSVKSRKNYFGVMRAIGAKSKEIPKLYFFESARLICKSFVWITIFGGILSVIVKIIIDSIFAKGFTLLGGVIISLPWYIIPIIILASMAVLIVVGLIFSFACSYKIAYDPIIESLER